MLRTNRSKTPGCIARFVGLPQGGDASINLSNTTASSRSGYPRPESPGLPTTVVAAFKCVEKRKCLPARRIVETIIRRGGAQRNTCPDPGAQNPFLSAHPQADVDSDALGLLVVSVFVSLHLAKTFGVGMQLRKQGFQLVDIDVQYSLKKLAADFLEPHLQLRRKT
jgi:hypothetical protein